MERNTNNGRGQQEVTGTGLFTGRSNENLDRALDNRIGEGNDEAIDEVLANHYGEEEILDRGDVPVTSGGGNHIRPFSVEQLNYGYIVTVGCHKFAIENHKTLTRVLGEYLANPGKTETKWYNNEFSLKRISSES